MKEIENLPLTPILKQALKAMVSLGFEPILVGGAIRDILLGGSTPTDLDFEIHVTPWIKGPALAEYEQLKTNLKYLGFTLKDEPFLVVRVDREDCSFQMLPPRREIYDERKSSFGHSDFTTEIDWKLDFKTASLRRDFTLNALGARFDGEKFELLETVGLLHLNEKKLFACDPVSFTKDPVRFLRAFRFKHKLGLEFSSELAALLSQMSLVKITDYYVLSEMQKSERPFSFMQDISQYKNFPHNYHVCLVDAKALDTAFVQSKGKDFTTKLCHALFVSHEPKEAWQIRLQGLNQMLLQDWCKLKQKLEVLENLSAQDFHLSFEEVQLKKHFPDLISLLLHPLWADARPLLSQHWCKQIDTSVKVDVMSVGPTLRKAYQVWRWLNP